MIEKTSLVTALPSGELVDSLVVFSRLNRTTKDWHTEVVTLRATKSFSESFFAPLRMTRPQGQSIKCTNVLWSNLDSPPFLFSCFRKNYVRRPYSLFMYGKEETGMKLQPFVIARAFTHFLVWRLRSTTELCLG